jgi:hypothetical protein
MHLSHMRSGLADRSLESIAFNRMAERRKVERRPTRYQLG